MDINTDAPVITREILISAPIQTIWGVRRSLCLQGEAPSSAAVKARELAQCVRAECVRLGSAQLDGPSVRVLGSHAIDAGTTELATPVVTPTTPRKLVLG
jgi:hypothetical protein